MEWYMWIIYTIIMFGALSSYLNYNLQRGWFKVSQAEPSSQEEVRWLRDRVKYLEEELCTQ